MIRNNLLLAVIFFLGTGLFSSCRPSISQNFQTPPANMTEPTLSVTGMPTSDILTIPNQPGKELILLLETKLPDYRNLIVFTDELCTTQQTDCLILEPIPDISGTGLWKPVISEDGKQALIYRGYDSSIYMMDVVIQQAVLWEEKVSFSGSQVFWLPDNKQLVFSSQAVSADASEGDPYRSRIALMDSESGKVQFLEIGLQGLQTPVGWLNDQEILICLSEYKDDAVLKSVLKNESLHRVDLQSGQTKLIADRVRCSSSSFSPDHQWVLLYDLDSIDDKNGKSDLFKLQIDGNTRVNLGTYLGGARWSPNGNWISLLNQNETGYELLILPAEGGEEARRLYQSADYFDYDWLPEEKEIFISQFGDESMEAYLLSLETGETKRLADPIIDENEYVIRGISWTP